MADRIGTDESGKGDYFGPLTVAAVYVASGDARRLRKLGVRDSKRLGDSRVLDLEHMIKDGFSHDVVVIYPERYNELYAKLGNLNILLAWAHARAIENLLQRVKCQLVISDQFGDERYLKESLMKEGKQVQLIQKPRAESDSAVAAASILARAAFLRALSSMRRRYGVVFPKGATHVIDAAVAYADLYGVDKLGEVAKTHFKTTETIKDRLKTH